MKKLFTRIACLALAATIALASCEGPDGDVGPQGEKGDQGDQGDKGDPGDDGQAAFPVVLANHSATSTFVKRLPGFESLELYSLLGSYDFLEQSPTYRFGGSADGAGLLRTNTGFIYLVNHEDNYAVSRITFDSTFRPVKGEYIVNSDGAQWRLCSATLATPAEHGFGPVFLTCGEGFGAESKTLAIDPFVSVSEASSATKAKPALGTFSAENAMPLPKTAYAGKTVIVVTDDDTGAAGGQVALYVSDVVGDLDNGKLHYLRTVTQDPIETNLTEGTAVDVEFVEIADQKTKTFAQMNSDAQTLKAIVFGRVEDVDYRKDGVGREIYFTVTGQAGITGRTKYGRVYKLAFDATNPLAGKLTCVLDGDLDAGTASMFQNPDNILVTKNYAYIQEDPNTYGDETHDAYIYQYNLTNGVLKKVFEADHRRDNPDAVAEYGATNVKGNWEYGALLDVSDILGIPNTFMLAVQPHTWKKPEFKGVDGGTLRPNEDQGSQIVVIRGLPK
jgi:hypothetical protein